MSGMRIVILARYPDDSAATIVRPVGKGEVLLIGVHLERPAPTAGGHITPPPRLAHSMLKSLLFP